MMNDSVFMKDTDVTESEVQDVMTNEERVINDSLTREKVPVLMDDDSDAGDRGLEEINDCSIRDKVVTSSL